MTKRYLEESERPGFGLDKYVCLHCINDSALKRQMRKKNASHTTCDYCQHHSKFAESIEVSDLLEIIVEGIEYEWERANNYLFYDSGEGGWQGKTFDSYDLLPYIQDETGIVNNVLLSDIAESLYDILWCKDYAQSEDEALEYAWNVFAKLIKYKYRYSFFLIPQEQYNDQLFDAPNSISPKELFDAMSYIINTHKYLIKSIPKNYFIYRARGFNELIDLNNISVKALAAPLAKDCLGGRMNPAGISLFYGAQDYETSYEEIIKCNQTYKTVVSAKFETLVPLRLLNLYDLQKLPSIFDPSSRHLRDPLKFLNKFRNEISKPNSSDINLEYIPTQAMTEYFRHIFKDLNGNKLNGIIYPSARCPNKYCYALFITNDECVEFHQQMNNNPILRLISKQVKIIE